MMTKRDLGVGYLIAVGIGLFGVLATGFLWPGGSPQFTNTPNTLLAVFTGLIVAGGFVMSGHGLANSELSGERIWRVALWSTVGLGIPTVLIVMLTVFYHEALAGLGWRSVAMINIAGGGVLGILVGMTTELKAEHDRTVALNQRNTVFLRLFRHDIRNSVTAILGHLDFIASERPDSDRSIEIVRNHIDRISELSEAARQLDDLESEAVAESVNLVPLVRDLLEDALTSHPEVVFETDFPPEATVRANDLLTSVVENVLRNAIEHNDGQPVVRVTIRTPGTSSDCVDLLIQDNGPGFSENELTVHTQANETALRHSDGIGLWLVRWIVNSYQGELSVENAEADGAIVTVSLPQA